VTRGFLLVPALVASLVLAGSAAAGPIPVIPDQPGLSAGYLGFCKQTTGKQEWSCYLHNLLRVVLASKDPATKLPQLDTLADQSGGYLEANCHMMMHVVGRAYTIKHHVTLGTLLRYLPRSNNPGCSSGFGMGLVMGLGPQLLSRGLKGAEDICNRAPTRFRQYTCFHALGHAFMRLYHGYLVLALPACRGLGPQAPDCVQGAFHDYWLGLSGQDGAKFTHGQPRTARVLCASQHGVDVVACWYRYYLTLPPKRLPSTAGRIDGLCAGLAGVQREGCIASASLISSSDPLTQFRICTRLAADDIDSCLRGVGVQNLPDNLPAELGFIARCAGIAPAARPGCYRWLGTGFSVLSNGRFAKSGCARVTSPAGRRECLEGARRMDDPLVTFA
jgi:hypothetical protein